MVSAAPVPSSLMPVGKVSLTFDDGLQSAYTNAAPILQTYGLTGTDYVPTGCVGSVGTCPANPDATYMNWAQVQALQNTFKWEVGSHTIDHPCLANDCDGVPTITPAQEVNELTGSKQALSANGINATAFASPYGDYDNNALGLIAKSYSSHRGFADIGFNTFPYNDLLLVTQQVEGKVTVAQVEKWVNTAMTNKQWLVLTFHDILPNASTNPDDYQWGSSKLTQLASYLKAQNVPIVNPSNGIASGSNNLIPNSSFSSGIAGGWATDDSANIKADSGDNGSYPNPTYSISITAAAKQTHLSSPLISVNPSQTYVLKNFMNVTSIKSGGFSFNINEYDATGKLISTQSKPGIAYARSAQTIYVKDVNFTYKPTSKKVATIELQVVAAANAGAYAYYANPQMYAEQ